MIPKIEIAGAGLAGVEAAWTIAKAGLPVRLYEMKPAKCSPAHKSGNFAELVCSNSFRSNDPGNVAGLLKEEMRYLSSFTMDAADATAVPAGKALAVDREKFAAHITTKIKDEPLIEVVEQEIESVDELTSEIRIIATGPLTTEKLSKSIAELTGLEYFYFYDSVAPILEASSIDFKKGYCASRYGYGSDDYWNFPLTENEYNDFMLDLLSAEKVTAREFEYPVYFEGCLPIETMAERGPGTLRHGPMKPFGLKDPRTGKEPFALVQLRHEDRERTMFNMVGFQTRMTWPEQRRVLRKIPGLTTAEFLRYGVIHRNTYIDSPNLLTPTLEMKSTSGLFFAGQITGVEGYIESAATGLWLGHYISNMLQNKKIDSPPSTTALGSLIWHATNPNHRKFVPMNVNFGLMPILEGKIKKIERKLKMLERARNDFEQWIKTK